MNLRKYAIFQIKITRREKGREECEICRLSPEKFSNEYLITKFGFDTAENGPFKLWERKTGVQVMRRVRQVTNAARRNVGAQSDNSGGQGIIVPSIYLPFFGSGAQLRCRRFAIE